VDWINFFTPFGYLGVFLISLIGAGSIIFPIPYTLSYYFFGVTMDPVLIAIIGGLGSAAGEIAGYLLGYYGHKMVNEKQKRKMTYLIKIFNRYGPLLLFVFALTPLPDDLIFIPLGILRYSFVKAFIPTLLGKILMAFIIAYSGRISFQLIRTVFSEAGWITTIITIVLLLLLIILMFRIDWEKIFKQYVDRK
jgi:membrane protein YqaA with SNARE-associated domain